MSTKDFDKVFKEKFEEHEFAFNPQNWERLTHALPKEKEKRRILPWLTGIAASVALLVGASWFLHNNNANDAATAIVKNTPATQSTTTIKNDNEAVKNNNNNQPILQQIVPVTNNLLVSNQRNNTQNSNAVDVKTTPKKETINSPISTEPYEKNLSPFSTPSFTKPNEKIVMENDPVPTPTKTITTENNHDPIFFNPDFERKEKDRKTSISLAGGFNYGSFNTGYGASVNARQKIGSRVFIEGDFGFMQNQEMIASAMSTEQFNEMNVANNASNARSRPARVEEKPYNIYYLQMSPSVGYQIHKNISVGVGADVQKLLDGKEEDRPVITTEQGFKLVPLWDAGITGKTEYTISKRLKAGVMYREGVNNLLQGNNNYYERRYLQIQMKLRLFGK